MFANSVPARPSKNRASVEVNDVNRFTHSHKIHMLRCEACQPIRPHHGFELLHATFKLQKEHRHMQGAAPCPALHAMDGVAPHAALGQQNLLRMESEM